MRGELPKGWGKDHLTSYFESVRKNQFATHVNKPDLARDCRAVDEMFRHSLRAADSERARSLPFFNRAHSAFLAASGNVWGGQLAEAQPVLRLCLEFGGYGFYVGENEPRLERWLARGENEKAREQVRNEFSHGKIRRAIVAVDPRLGSQYETLYQLLVDLGAHPNALGLSLGITKELEGGVVKYGTAYLHGDDDHLETTLFTSVQVGLVVLHLMQLVFPLQFKVFGLDGALAMLRRRY